MLDQSFSSKNFITIFEIENRKGNITSKFLSSEYLNISEQIKESRREIRALKSIESNSMSILELQENQKFLESEKDVILHNELLAYSKRVNEKNFSFNLSDFIDGNTNKKVYVTDRDLASFFAMKQLQFNINRTFKVKPGNRFLIVKQLKAILQDNFPKYVVRTDIKSFYESIPQEKLLNILSSNSLLSPKSLSLIKDLFYHFNKLSNQLEIDPSQRNGVPRGIGVSAYLSELYMRHIDDKIKRLPNVSFYCRYVDDIIVIFTPPGKEIVTNYYLELIKEIFDKEDLLLNEKYDDGIVYKLRNILKADLSDEDKLLEITQIVNNLDANHFKLQYLEQIVIELNSVDHLAALKIGRVRELVFEEIKAVKNNKTYQCNLYNSNAKANITFLGYCFLIENLKYQKISLSANKIEKYKVRLRKCFDAFFNEKVVSYRAARKLLTHRLAFLTQNTKLDRPKKGYIGIYYSNNLLEYNSRCLSSLNSILHGMIDERLPIEDNPELNIRLKRFCFIKGFNEKLFFNMKSIKKSDSLNRAKLITDFRTRKSTSVNNFEKIVLAWK